jgi:hypothetical protein
VTRAWLLIGADGRPVDSPTPGTLGGNRRTRVYGRFDCAAARRGLARGTYAANRVFFADELTAIAAGYRPCGTCMRAAYERWRAQDSGTEPGGVRPSSS